MDTKRWQKSWVGRTDHEAAENTSGSELGPIATAVKKGGYDRVYLLSEVPIEFRLSEARSHAASGC
jgi:hypothetical protein